ncbi:Chromatin structure-remodeling complex protein rsc9 [Marasmius crinis-equi]|uniref:Chromatin structure-remodeling complex protein rsc9 n=1 Tax=Marasmius crinis-equi TaxID=585013 RepID=A0ABR3FVG2_9AGAR
MTSYAKPVQVTQVAASRHLPPAPNVADDYERWYTEPSPSNRMVLSLRSGIDSEIGWALDRLCRLCRNEQFFLRPIPGLTNALFEWPEWFVREGYKEAEVASMNLFAPNSTAMRRRRHALESLFVLRNSSLFDQNSNDFAENPRTMPLIQNALHNLNPELDSHYEFALHCIDLFQSVGASYTVPSTSAPPKTNILPPLLQILSTSSNRTLIIAALSAVNLIFSNPQNILHLTPDSPALEAAIRYLPLFVDKPLLEACLNYLFVHLSSTSMLRAFLLHPMMPSVLKILVDILIFEEVDEDVTLDVTGTINTVPSTVYTTHDHELTKAELDGLLDTPEPQRCYDWMKAMFVSKTDGEVTQVDFWNLYKDTFSQYADRHPLLVASDVIKNVNFVFPHAQAMVIPGPPQRFVVRGVDRRKDTVVADKLRCQWDRSQCPHESFGSHNDLCKHLLAHLDSLSDDATDCGCLWSTCPRAGITKKSLRSHVLTHVWSPQSPDKHPSQSDTITLSSPTSKYPIPQPTTRPPPAPRSTVISYKRPAADPPSSSLTALLCIRILFRSSFTSTEAAPRVDEDHFGFPGIVEDSDPMDVVESLDSDSEGERRGRKAFSIVRASMEKVQIKDEVLNGWIEEMVDAGLTGTIQNE